MTWLAAFHDLPKPSQPNGLTLGLALCEGCRLARTYDDHLALAVRVSLGGGSHGRQLENLRYDPPQALRVTGVEGERVENLALLTCRSSDRYLREAFLRIALAFLENGGLQLTEGELDQRLDELVRLFRALSRPGSQTVQGLWAELAVVVWSAEPRLAVSYWHTGARALHDFDSGPDRLEVKSCSTGVREHAVRLEQLLSPSGGHVVVASVVLEESEDGATVSDLFDRILARANGDPEVHRRVRAIVTQSLGSEWREGDTRRFHLEKACQSLRLYDAETVPRVTLPLPAGVRQVRFVVDLSYTDAMDLGAARGLTPFFAAVLPPVDAGAQQS